MLQPLLSSELAQYARVIAAFSRFFRALGVEIEGARRYHRCCSILLLDIDHFKQFNDRHGHDAGVKTPDQCDDWVPAQRRPLWPLRRQGIPGAHRG